MTLGGRITQSVFVIVAGAGLGLAVASVRGSLAKGPESPSHKLVDEVVEVVSRLNERYVTAPDLDKLREGAVKGMVEALDDPYTVYVPASELRDFRKDLTGEYVGIGAQINVQDGWLTIISPLEDSPAYRQGLMPDDRVSEIDGKSTQGLTADQCVALLTGEAGSPVKLLIERKGEKFEITIIREKIKTRAVKGFHRDEADAEQWDFLIDPATKIGYIRLTQFTPGCAAEVEKALASLGARDGGLRGLVLDLRGNPGGLLTEAEALADLFLESGVIVSTRGRSFPEKVARAVKPGTLPEFPIAVLLNGASASASEVLAGALVENNRAIVVGTRSFGKGSVQSLIPLTSGGELKVTEQGYYLPSGRSITRTDDSEQWGVDPTPGFYVPMSDDELIAMIEVRRRQELLRSGAASASESDAKVDWNNADAVLEALKDKQLTAAVRAVQAHASSGAWPKIEGETQPAGQATAGELRRLREFQNRLFRELERTERRIAALDTASEDAAAAPKDLWDDSLALKDGTVEVRDKDGKVVTRLRITGNNLERWLLDADVTKIDDAPAKP